MIYTQPESQHANRDWQPRSRRGTCRQAVRCANPTLARAFQAL